MTDLRAATSFETDFGVVEIVYSRPATSQLVPGHDPLPFPWLLGVQRPGWACVVPVELDDVGHLTAPSSALLDAVLRAVWAVVGPAGTWP